MNKRILPILLALAVIGFSIVSCNKSTVSNTDQTLNFFPVQMGKYITYEVDSVIYDSTSCLQLESHTQLKYAITDTFRDQSNRLSYLMNIMWRTHDGADWINRGVIYLTPSAIAQSTTNPPAGTPLNCLLYTQDGSKYEKMVFPILEGTKWAGNQYVEYQDSLYSYLYGWTYYYSNLHKSYNNGYINFDNTVTVNENDESVNYPMIDSNVYSYRTFAKEVYAYNVGMIYKEWTHWTYHPHPANCVNGFTVIMRAIDHN